MSFSNVSQNDLKKYKEYDDHIIVRYVYDEKSGLEGFIAIHNTNLGPAVGGTRMYPYTTIELALADVLRLSRSMSYKCALAGVSFGGGKAVIVGDPLKLKSNNLLESYAREIRKLKGDFYTGEDVGISEENVQYMLKLAPYFIGKSGQAGDPSPYAALSVFYSIKTAVKSVYGEDSLVNKTISIKGVGKVGSALTALLLRDGAKIFVADVDKKAVDKLVKNNKNIISVDPKKIHKAEVDVYSPCAMGGEFNLKSAMEVNARIICGGANNQLETSEVGDCLFDRNIVYIPDYVANSGGLIDVVDELEQGGYNKLRVNKRIKKVKETVQMIVNESRKKRISTNRVSDMLAEKIFMKQ